MSSVINTLVSSIQDNILFVCIVLFFILIVLTLALAVIFHKIGQKFWKALVPLYNIMTLLTILNIPVWMVLLLIIPFVNIIGIPIMILIIGWKLGTLCHKNIIVKIGLVVCPILFLPLLAASTIDLDGNYKKIVVIPVAEKKEFTLDPVVVTGNVEIEDAMNLSNSETLQKIAVKKKKEKPVIEKKEIPTASTLADYLSKADKERPTAQDLTFDYNMVYSQKEEEKVLVIENVPFTIPKKDNIEAIKIEEPIKEENNEIEYSNLYPEKVEEEPAFPKIHEVVLEEASPIDETSVGPIPINQRYDKQRKVQENSNEPIKRVNKEPVEEINSPIALTPIELPEVIMPIPEIGNLNMATPPIVDSSISSMMAAPPNLSIKEVMVEPISEPVEIPIQQIEAVEPTKQIASMVSMNIEEPDTLPVGILFKEEKNDQEEISVVLPGDVPEPEPPPYQYLEQAPIVEETLDLLPNPTMIFQTDMGAEPMLRQVPQPKNEPQLDKVCPKCSVKLKRDCPVCIMCGYKF
jgi:ABC-type uncharacterized transport system, permease component